MDIFIWSFILIGAIIVAFVVVMLVRRQYFQAENFPKEGFTIADLRALRQSGQMSAEEYEKARAALIGKLDEKPVDSSASDKPSQ
jgi:hypothetical protein